MFLGKGRRKHLSCSKNRGKKEDKNDFLGLSCETPWTCLFSRCIVRTNMCKEPLYVYADESKCCIVVRKRYTVKLRVNYLSIEVVQSNKYYKSRAVSVTSEVGLTTDRDLAEPTCLRNTMSFYTSTIPEVTWYEPLYNNKLTVYVTKLIQIWKCFKIAWL